MQARTKKVKNRLDQISGQTYQATMAGAGAMWTEMQALLEHGSCATTYEVWEKLVVEENILSKKTMANRKAVWKKLVKRYLLDIKLPVFASFCAEYYSERSVAQRGLLGYLLLCATDRLVRELSSEWLASRIMRSGTVLATEDLERHLTNLLARNVTIAEWSASTRLHICQHYLGAIRDFGLATGKALKRADKPIAGSNVLLFAVQLGRLEGLNPLDLLQSQWMRILGLDLDVAITRMYQLNADGLVRFRILADIAELTIVKEPNRGDSENGIGKPSIKIGI